MDNSITVEGKHEERQDEHGYVSRQFTRRYVLPKGVNPAAVTSQFSHNGTLTIQVGALLASNIFCTTPSCITPAQNRQFIASFNFESI